MAMKCGLSRPGKKYKLEVRHTIRKIKFIKHLENDT